MKRVVIALWLGVLVMPAAAQPLEVPRDYESMTQRDREREMQAQKWSGPSGFWTSPHKSEHGAYRYRLLGIGVMLMLTTGFLTLRLIRRTKAPVRQLIAMRPTDSGEGTKGESTFPTARTVTRE